MSPALQRQGQARAPLEGAYRAGDPPPLPLPQAFHVLWPPVCLISNSYFYSLRFSVNSSWVEGGVGTGGMGQQEEQEGLQEPRALPMAGQAAPLLAGPLAETESAEVAGPTLFLTGL